MATAVLETLLTAEEFRRLPDDGRPQELKRGKVIFRNLPAPRHGQICGQVYYLLRRHLEEHPLGHLVGNDAGIVTEHDPDTVRGTDIAFYSFQRVPPGPLPQGYLPVAPELGLEVRSPGDRWGRIWAKVGESLEAGVKVVCVLDQMPERYHVYGDGEEIQVFLSDHDLLLSDVLPEFRVVMRRFFE